MNQSSIGEKREATRGCWAFTGNGSSQDMKLRYERVERGGKNEGENEGENGEKDEAGGGG